MIERDAIFRERLITLMTALNGGEARDPALCRAVGTFVYSLVKEAGARDWTDLKRRADAGSYDAMLRLFQREGEAFHKKGDTKSVRAVELLGVSLVARHQRQSDLLPGVGFLDRFIERCAELVRPVAPVVVNVSRRARH